MSAAPASERKLSPASALPKLLGGSRRRAALGFGLVILLIYFALASDQWMDILNYTMIYAIATLGLNVLSGYTGQVSLGIAFFMAIGAYTAVWLGGDPTTTVPTAAGRVPALGLGLSFVIWLPAAGIVAALVGALVGPSALRLKGFYLGIVSLALIFIGNHFFTASPRLTGGPEGRFFPAPQIGSYNFLSQNDIGSTGFAITKGQQFFLLIFPVLVLCALFVANVMRSRTGRAFQAVRDNEVGAAIMGVNLFRAKMGAFILSSFLAGIAGALFASYNSVVRPDYWSLVLSIQFVAAIIVGGVASVWGSILGAAFVFALPLIIDHLKLLPVDSSNGGLSSGDLNTIIYGLLIIVFLLFEPGGLAGLIRRGQRLSQRLNQRKQKGDQPATITAISESDSQADVESAPLSSGEGA